VIETRLRLALSQLFDEVEVIRRPAHDSALRLRRQHHNQSV
jgi:hypothetical protein